MSVVTRFAPSPTGALHIGGARTALFNWLFARHHGGTFYLRIEDTDRERSTPESERSILESLTWLGLTWDGDIVRQFERRDRHAEVARSLIESGQAYYCYCSPEELEEMRVQARQEGRRVFYDRRWRDKGPEDAPPGVDPVVRIKAPLEGVSVINDRVQGDVNIDNRTLDDFVILRSDGTPTYMLSVVVDDYDMGVTHVIRGDDHLNNAFRQKIIFDAMGWKLPEFAHIPMIHAQDGTRLSKRHGAQSTDEYRDMGYLPEALKNYLMRLGWSHGNDEIISIEQAVEWFSLDKIGKSPARFDYTKIDYLNGYYMQNTDDERMLELVLPLLQKRYGLVPDEGSKAWILAGMHDLKSRAKNLLQVVDDCVFYVQRAPIAYEEDALEVLRPTARDALVKTRDRLARLNDFNDKAIEDSCRSLALDEYEKKLAIVAMPFRAALTGRAVSPPIFKVAEILGKDETLQRLDAAIAFCTQK